MSSLDIILLGVLLIFTFLGLSMGLIYSFGVFLGNIVGLIAAGYLMEPVAQVLKFLVFGNENLARILVFVIIFLLVSHIVGTIFWFLNKVFKLISIIPFLKTINRIGGLILGFLTGSLTVGLVLYIMTNYPLSPEMAQSLLDSQYAKGLIVVAKILTPLIPV